MRTKRRGIDNKDKQILSALQENSKISFKDLAKSLGVPVTTIWRRVKNLEEKGVIKKFTIEIDRKKLQRLELYEKSKDELINMILERDDFRNL